MQTLASTEKPPPWRAKIAINAVEQTTLNEGTHDASFGFILYLCDSVCTEMRQCMKLYLTTILTIHRFKHTIDDANMKMHMGVEARAKTMKLRMRGDGDKGCVQMLFCDADGVI